MTRYLLSCLLFLTSSTLFASEYEVDLSSEYMTVSYFDYYVAQVVDAAVEKNCIGYVRSNKEIYPVFFKKETEAELMAFFSRNMGKSSGKKPLIVRINKIFVQSSIYTNKEMATASISLSFFEKEKGIYKELLTTAQMLQNASPNAFEIYPAQVAQCLTQCFQALRDRKTANKLIPRMVDASAISRNGFSNLDFPIAKGMKGKKCIFDSYTDFLYNTGDTTTNFTVSYHQGDSIQDVFAKFHFSNEKDEKRIWGFWDGEYVYAQLADKKFYPLTFDKGDCYIWGYEQMVDNQLFNSNEKLLAASIFLSAISIMTGGGAIIFFRIPALPNYDIKGGKKKYYLDYATSEFVLREKPLVYQAKTLIYSSIYNNQNTQMEVWINGEKTANLAADTYYEWLSHSDIRNAELVFKTATSSDTIRFVPQIFRTEVLTCKINKKGEIRTFWLPIEAKKDLFTRIKANLTKRVGS